MLFGLLYPISALKAYFFDDKGHIETFGPLGFPFCSLDFEG